MLEHDKRAKSGKPIGPCEACGLPLPLRAVRCGERAIGWVCTGCGARYEAVLDSARLPDLIENVRPARIEFDRKAIQLLPEAIAEFVARIVPAEYQGPERRGFERYRLVTPVAAVALTDGLAPIGQTFMAMMQDISRSGIALVSTRAVHSDFLAVEIPDGSGKGIQVVVHPVQCRPLGRFYGIAGPFLTRMVETATSCAPFAAAPSPTQEA